MLFKGKWFWLLFGVVALAATLFSLRFFPRAFPLVTLELRMDREGALERARVLADRYGWGPQDYEQAASFGLDSEVQNFVELEGGGREVFREMVGGETYSPYAWTVRHFREREATTTRIRFRPDGTPYGFLERLPEERPGEALETQAALALAEQAAAGDWGIDLSRYRRVEDSQELRLGGRIDHTFVYERIDRSVGEGKFRLRLGIGGSRLTEVTHFVEIPEGFERRYQEMRSANETIGSVGGAAILLIYLAGGCLVGVFVLSRKKWILWKRAVLWGVAIALLQGLAALNSWPLEWMGFDTALSYQEFRLTQIVQVIAQVVGMGALFCLTFLAAESLGRRAFPHHAQFWKVWSRNGSNSRQILAQTAGAYLLIPIFFAYEVFLYFFAERYLGWWSPSDALFQPDVLATYVPWFTALAISLQAGFWEECLFRAVPLACAALLGERFGKKGLWLLGAMVVQAVIFGSGHAPYANQPAYARVVELILPSILFGALYLAYGLLPGIILHFAFDVVWFALPLFVSTAEGARLNQVVVILLTLVPLWVVLVARLRRGAWSDLPDNLRNGSWEAPAQVTEREVTEAGKPVEGRLHPALVRFAWILALAGLAVWIVVTPFQGDAPPMPLERSAAEVVAKEFLELRGIDAGSWEGLPTIQASPAQQHQFVWRTAGRDTYSQLSGSYLSEPAWRVRFARFEGDIEERAEEHWVFIGADGKVIRYRHLLPEARPGATLEVDRARMIALREIESLYGLGEQQIKEISAEPSKLPNRQDWAFTFSEPGVDLPEGETRILVELAGDEVVDSYRRIHVPEEWERRERSRTVILQVILVLCGICLASVLVGGLIAAVARWREQHFVLRLFLTFLAVAVLTNILGFLNNWPALKASFSTAQPLFNQVLILLAGGALSSIFLGVFVAMIAALLPKSGGRARLRTWQAVALAVAVGFSMAGLSGLLKKLGPSLEPSWPDYGALNSIGPLVAPALGGVSNFLLLTTVLLLFFSVVQTFSGGWQRRRLLSVGGIILFGLGLQGLGAQSLTSWLTAGAALGVLFAVLYVLVYRHALSLIPLSTAAYLVLNDLRQGLSQAYPGAFAGAVIGVLLVTAAAVCWWRLWERQIDPAEGEASAGLLENQC